MSDTELEPSLAGQPLPNTYNPIVATSGLLPGMAVAASATANKVAAANAAAAATTYATGLLIGPGPTQAGQRSNVRYSGVLSLTAAEWAAATVEGTVLTPGVPYFTSSGTPGKITKTAPSGEGDTPEQVGVGLSPLSIMVQVAGEGIVGPPGPPASPTVERIAFGGGTAIADPTIDCSFLTDGGGSHGNVTLADGTVDGFEKKIMMTFIADGAVTITFSGGLVIHIASGQSGSATLAWDALDEGGVWQVTGLVNATF